MPDGAFFTTLIPPPIGTPVGVWGLGDVGRPLSDEIVRSRSAGFRRDSIAPRLHRMTDSRFGGLSSFAKRVEYDRVSLFQLGFRRFSALDRAGAEVVSVCAYSSLCGSLTIIRRRLGKKD